MFNEAPFTEVKRLADRYSKRLVIIKEAEGYYTIACYNYYLGLIDNVKGIYEYNAATKAGTYLC